MDPNLLVKCVIAVGFCASLVCVAITLMVLGLVGLEFTVGMEREVVLQGVLAELMLTFCASLVRVAF